MAIAGLMWRRCAVPGVKQVTRGPFPAGVQALVQSGPGVQVLAVSLSQVLPLQQTGERLANLVEAPACWQACWSGWQRRRSYKTRAGEQIRHAGATPV